MKSERIIVMKNCLKNSQILYYFSFMPFAIFDKTYGNKKLKKETTVMTILFRCRKLSVWVSACTAWMKVSMSTESWSLPANNTQLHQNNHTPPLQQKWQEKVKTSIKISQLLRTGVGCIFVVVVVVVGSVWWCTLRAETPGLDSGPTASPV